jgi:nucleoside-diphosphate-sugar epimerase
LTVLITGAGGLVGRNLIWYFDKHGVESIPTDVSGYKVSGNILDADFVFKTLASLDFDAIIHLAAITDLKKTIENPKLCYEVNCFGTLNMLELAARKNVKRFIFSSSANVFGAPKENPVVEDSPIDPRVPYDYSKVIGENMVMSYSKSKGLPVTITRSWLLFGEHDQSNRAVLRFINACLSGQPITLYNHGRDTTAPSHVHNFARLLITILKSKEAVGEAFNFGGEKVVSVKQLAALIKKLTSSKSKLILAPPRSELEKDPQISYPSTRKIKRVLHYDYELTLSEGLQRTIEWARHERPP